MDTSGAADNAKKEPAIPQQPTLDVGAALREARERLGMSVHDVAERIKFAPKQVETLEANDFAHLPEPAFLRGFVRSYARALHLDEMALIAALPTEISSHVAAKAHAVNVAFPNTQALRRSNVLLIAGALGIALVLGLFVLFHDEKRIAKTTQVVVEPVILPKAEVAVSGVAETALPTKSAEVVQVSEPDNAVGNKVPKTTENKAAEKSGAGLPAAKPPLRLEAASSPAAAVRQPKLSGTGQATEQALSRVEPAPAPAADNPPVPLEVLKRRPLHLVFLDNSWVEVKDAQGVILLSKNNPRGTEKWVGGPRHEPYDITIAHPSNVKLFFRGKEIDLSAYAGMDVAHLKVE